MTNQQKLQTLRNLTGPSLYSVIIKELGPGTIHIPLDDGIPESRNLKIRAEFNSPEFEEKPLEVIYRTLAEHYNIDPAWFLIVWYLSDNIPTRNA